ncbi:MAG: 16S rRNA methyltransferase GidB [Chloroflexi bacterium OLB13]|nr:MAG: 16S rRNA methyltransferase GidB [Chloroflexi bacterium OLB13]
MNLADSARTLFGVELTEPQLGQFDRLTTELLSWNAHTNLTAITDPQEITLRHYLDSLSLIPALNLADGMRLADVGSGAGFPGLALQIALPSLYTTMIEATGKKARFISHAIEALGLERARVLAARAEEAGRNPHQRAKYDVVVARAVARLPVLVEYLLPLAKIDGLCVAMKGITAEAEVVDSRGALAILGGEVERTERVELPSVDDPHFLVIIRKTKPTPPGYPRNAGIPAKKPLT